MANPSLVMTTELGRSDGRLIVTCSIEHLVPSGLTVAELFARLRTELFAAVGEAASQDPVAVEFRSTTRVSMDMDESDPSLMVTIFNPRRFLADFDGHMERMQQLATRYVATAHLVEVPR